MSNDKIEIITKLTGVTRRNAQEIIKLYGCPDVGYYWLKREPDNPWDKNATIVYTVDHQYLGYLPRAVAATIAPLMDKGKDFEAVFVKINRAPGYETVGLTVRIVER